MVDSDYKKEKNISFTLQNDEEKILRDYIYYHGLTNIETKELITIDYLCKNLILDFIEFVAKDSLLTEFNIKNECT